MDNWINSVYSDGSLTFLSPEKIKYNEKVTIRLRLQRENPVEQIYLRIAPQGEEELKPMDFSHEDSIFSWYKIRIRVTNRMFSYRFQLNAHGEIFYYNQRGVIDTTPLDIYDFKIIVDFYLPPWLKNRIFYQIFPDRFCCKTPPQLPKYKYLGHRPILKKWNEQPGEYNETFCMDFFGGNISGVFSKIKYLKELGINAIYFNPVFQAPTNHRYDVQDYFKIDPVFGDNSSFAILLKNLHQHDIRVILDGVFNHSGMACRFFNKAKYYDEVGAYQATNSEYSSYYCFIEHPRKYHCWNGVDTLPKFNYRSQKLRNFIYQKSNSVMQYWLDEPYCIDGWRIDAANMLGRSPGQHEYMPIWKELRSAIKSKFPQSYLLGEHFFDASELLQGNALDAAMNYQGFTFPVRNWLTQKTFDAKKLDQQLTTFRSVISWPVMLSQYNLINSHDIPRLNSLLPHQALLELAAVFLFTYPGIPAIYYGEEIGLNGGISSESSRKPMVWEKQHWNECLFTLYQKLIKLRRSSAALKEGGIKTLIATENVYGFARFYEEELIVILFNRGEQCEISLDLRSLGIEENDKFISWNGKIRIGNKWRIVVPERGYYLGIKK